MILKIYSHLFDFLLLNKSNVVSFLLSKVFLTIIWRIEYGKSDAMPFPSLGYTKRVASTLGVCVFLLSFCLSVSLYLPFLTLEENS